MMMGRSSTVYAKGKPLPGTAPNNKARNSNAGLLTTKAKTYDKEDLTQSQFSSAAAAVDKDLLASGISEKDLEIEHLQTQVVALTEKADVVEDMRKDVTANKELL
jgi:hypothetical protein